ncbi:MAG TPA: hypothetical protein VGD29_27755 [Actinoplanes sp.]
MGWFSAPTAWFKSHLQPSRGRFAAQALRIVRRMPGVRSATYHPDKFAIALYREEGGTAAWLYLSNIFQEAAAAPASRRRERLEQLVRIMTASRSEDNWESVRGRLRPVVRGQTFGQAGPPGMQPPLSRPALPFLHELVVVDHKEAMAYVTAARLPDWGVTADEVFAAARENLAGIAARSLDGPWEHDGGSAMITMIDDGDAYFTSLLLAPGWLAGVGERIGAPIMAFAPDNHTLVLCSPPDDLRPLYDLVEKHFTEATRSVSPVGYVAGRDGRTVPYSPPPGHPHEIPVRRAEAILAASEYGAQTAWLAGQYLQAGIDVHVGELLAVAPANGPAETVATWVDGIATLLPAARSIVFARNGAVELQVPWSAVAQEIDLEPEPLLAPPRYRVEGWPAPDVMDRLRNRD